MNLYVQNLTIRQLRSENTFKIETQYTATGVILLGLDLSGNVLATRTLTTTQFADSQLTSLVTADLETTLQALGTDSDLFPHPFGLQQAEQ